MTTTGGRGEYVFYPQPVANKWVVSAVGGVGAAIIGAGVYGWFFRESGPAGVPLPYAPQIASGGIILIGVAMWLGTSSANVLRIGDAGFGVERDGVLRMPWYAIESVRWNDGSKTLEVRGTIEGGESKTITIAQARQPHAIHYLVAEARRRIPKVVDAPEPVGAPFDLGGFVHARLDPPQIVGRRCAATGTVISFEPDAATCGRCERAYLKRSMPDTCGCGATLKEGAAPAAVAEVVAAETPATETAPQP
jgi:hypothetical protein